MGIICHYPQLKKDWRIPSLAIVRNIAMMNTYGKNMNRENFMVNNNRKFKTLLSNTVIFGLGNFLTKLILFFLMPLYTSRLTVEQYGVAELLNNSIEVVVPIITLCIIDAVFRFSIDDDVDHKRLLSTAISVLLTSYIFLFVICTVFFAITGFEYT